MSRTLKVWADPPSAKILMELFLLDKGLENEKGSECIIDLV